MNQLKHVDSEQRFPMNHYIITFGTVPGWPFPPTDTGHYMITKTVFFLLFLSYRLVINGMLSQDQEGFIHRNNPKSVQ